jgi:hypothetical protein
MAQKKAPRRQVKRVTRRTLRRFVGIVGFDGARAAFDAVEAGADTGETMRALRPFIDRYVAAHGEDGRARRDISRRMERGEV